MIVKVDRIGINAVHFASMSKEEAVNRMIADGFVPDNSEDWAGKAWEECFAKVNGIAKPKVKKEKKDKDISEV